MHKRPKIMPASTSPLPAVAMPELPVVFTGHLFAAGGRTLPEDGVRELYLGTLPQAGVDLFPLRSGFFAGRFLRKVLRNYSAE